MKKNVRKLLNKVPTMVAELTYSLKHSFLELLNFTETFIRYINCRHLPVCVALT